MTQEQKIIRAKLGLLELAKQLGNVSRACKMMGYSRDSFYRFKDRRATTGKGKTHGGMTTVHSIIGSHSQNRLSYQVSANTANAECRSRPCRFPCSPHLEQTSLARQSRTDVSAP